MFSFVIPTFGEEKFDERLGVFIAFLGSHSWSPYEILVVDDSPLSHFLAMSNALKASALEHVILLRGEQKGKGAALRQGVAHAKGGMVFMLDADFPVDFKVLCTFREMLSTRYDLVLAERTGKRISATPMRTRLSHALYLMQRSFIFHGPFFRDTQCGFKAIRHTLARQLFPLLRVNGGMIDIELLYAAHKNHFCIGSVPVTEKPSIRPSQIRVLKCLRQDPIDLVKTKARGMMGHYKLTPHLGAACVSES